MEGQLDAVVVGTNRSPATAREKGHALLPNAVTGDRSPATAREKGHALLPNAVTGDQSPAIVREKDHALSRNPVDVPRRGGTVMVLHQD